MKRWGQKTFAIRAIVRREGLWGWGGGGGSLAGPVSFRPRADPVRRVTKCDQDARGVGQACAVQGDKPRGFLSLATLARRS